jgi:uncharacterized protein YjeT (DUF2065 family)
MPVTDRVVSATPLFIFGAGFALLAVLVHFEFIRIYGDVGATAFEGLTWGFAAGPSALALGLVAVVAVIGLMLLPRKWMRLTAVAIPVLTLIGMFAVTPAALGQKLETHFDSTPQCVIEGTKPTTADLESQRTFDSIEHVGYFSGANMAGASMIGASGCTRVFVLSGDVDVLQHYRAALPAAGWEVVEDDGRHLRAQLDGRAFDVMPCLGGGVVWAGSDDDPSYGQGTASQPGGIEICPHDL